MKTVKTFNKSYNLVMSSDAKFVCRTIGSKTFLYENQNWDHPVLLTKPTNPGDVKFSPDNSFLIIQNTSGNIYIYETENFSPIKRIVSNKSYKMIEHGGCAFVANKKMVLCIAIVQSREQVLAFDLETTNWYPITDFNENYHIGYTSYSEKENAHLFQISRINKITDDWDYQILKVYEDDLSMEILNLPLGVFWDELVFNHHQNTYISLYKREIHLLSSDLKKIIKKENLSIPNNGVSIVCDMSLSKNGKFIVIAYSECVVILDSEHLDIIRIERIPYACFAQFGNDDEFLLVGTWDSGYILENNLTES